MKLIAAIAATAMLNTEVKADWGWGWCPEKPAAATNFDVEKYAGTWYEIKHDKTVWYQ